MKFNVEKATSWEQVTEAAALETRCIMLGKVNHERAKQTWEVFHGMDDVIYYLVRDKSSPNKLVGYVRLLCVTQGPTRTWIADFVSPNTYEAVILAARCVNGAVLVKEFTCDDDLLTKNWPKFSTTFQKLDKYPYHNTSVTESNWLVVV